MKKTATSKLKKGAPIKEGQKITSFFSKLAIQKTTKSSNVNNKPQTSNAVAVDNEDTDFADKNVKISPCKIKSKCTPTKKKTPPKEKKINNVQSLEKDLDNSDNDFIVDTKEKVKGNILSTRSKIKSTNDKVLANNNKIGVKKSASTEKCKDNVKENSCSPENNANPEKGSLLIVDLNDQELKSIDQTNDKLLIETPEKTYLQKDDVLLDITNSTNCSESLTSFQNITKKFSHSTPADNLKKRKFETESPNVIPPTPEEYLQNVTKPKTKLCIESKFPQIKEESDITSPPKKKIHVLENELNIENSNKDIPIKSTTNFIVSPVKCISPSKSSPHKGERLKCPISPSKSNLKSKRTLIFNHSEVVKIEPIINDKEDKVINDEIDDLFDDDWNVEINQLEEKINQLNLETWQYCKILEVSRDNHQNIIIKVKSVENKQETSCSLQGVWQYSNLQPDDLVNILAVKNSHEIPFCINNKEGFLVYEPDIMISPTSIVGSQFCKRRGILAEKFRGFESENKAMIVGTLVHKLLQDILKKEISKAELVEKRLFELLSSREMINTSYSSQIPIEEIKNEILPFVPKIVNFVEKYIRNNKNKVQNYVKKEDWKGTIHEIRDIEENIWCPQLGIKGKIDITVKSNSLGSVLPLELKTGRATMSIEHRGQVIMYIMMMTELGYNVASGLLLYLREDILREVCTSSIEKRDLLMLRNDFAYYIKRKPKIVNTEETEVNSEKVLPELDPTKRLQFAELPEPINHHSACGKCPYANICTALLSRDESYTLSETHPLKKISTECLQNLEPSHIDYFIHWTSLLNLESNYKPPMKELKDIWRLPPHQRENRGKSICYLKISSRVTEEKDSFIHTFARSSDEKTLNIITEKGLKNDFIMSGLSVGNYVVVSIDSRFAVATGFIQHITHNSITVALERDLNERYSNKIFHIDTYESQQIVNFSTTSVAALLDITDRAKRLRELIIDRQISDISGDLSKSMVAKGADILKKLNKIQQRAVLKALTVKDYLLIKGMPGTGKTATIVSLITLLVRLKKTVLITSHTHSAVDNVCLRLLNNNVDFLRLGSENRVHPQLKHRTESVLTAHCKTVEEIQKVYDSAQVVAVTCLAAAHPMLNQRKLDICIVDESTQVIQCSVIKALLSTNSFILIGDPDQLPPVVRNPEAVRLGMNESLFERLDNLNSTITLTLQYRMNKTITDLANSLTYKGELQCADEIVASAVLHIPTIENLIDSEQWILKTLDNKLENSVIAIDTGPTWNISAQKQENLLSDLQVAPQNIQEDEERKCCNNLEGALVLSVVQALKKTGVSSGSIGVIAPYRAQVYFLKKLVSKLYNDESSEQVEVNTVDQYQGRDKEVIIYSCTRSRDVSKVKNNTGFEILDDKRRLTVAITRAKYKLIIIGDFVTLKEYSPFEKLLNSLDSHQKLILNDESVKFEWKEAIKHLEN